MPLNIVANQGTAPVPQIVAPQTVLYSMLSREETRMPHWVWLTRTQLLE